MSEFRDRLTLNEKFEKMMSLGLWPEDLAQPDPQLLERIQKLNQEIENRLYELYLPEDNPEQVLDQIRERYHQESKRRREKQRQKQKDQQQKQQENQIFLGKKVSSQLNQIDTDEEKLRDQELPLMSTIDDVSDFLGIEVNRIKWMTYHQRVADYLFYNDYKVEKIQGGYRQISAPNKEIKKIQSQIKEEILDKLEFPDYVTGFVKSINIYQNARIHANGDIIINIDIKNYFHSIRFYQVRAVFKNLGYSGQVSTILSLLTTKQDHNTVTIDNKEKYALSEYRYLPQGAPSSPTIANLVASKIDYQLKTRAEKLDFKYSRYADDITFSTTNNDPDINAILYMSKKTLEFHGFEAHPEKTNVMYQHEQQRVTGLIVNSGNPKVPRKWRRKLRAAVHQFQFIEDSEELEREYLRLKGCLQHLKLSHPQVAHQYAQKIDNKKQNFQGRSE